MFEFSAVEDVLKENLFPFKRTILGFLVDLLFQLCWGPQKSTEVIRKLEHATPVFFLARCLDAEVLPTSP